nr:hypothetical protein CFP56_31243 [Quercus suber]
MSNLIPITPQCPSTVELAFARSYWKGTPSKIWKRQVLLTPWSFGLFLLRWAFFAPFLGAPHVAEIPFICHC